MPLPALIPAIAGVVQAGASVLGQGMANSANKRQAQLAYQYERKMFDYANKYNSPAEQMKRLQEAGLNPNLVYGNGATGNIAQPIPKYEPARQQPIVPDFGGAYDTFRNALFTQLDLKARAAEIEQVEANTQLVRQRQETERLNQNLLGLTGRAKDWQFFKDQRNDIYNYEILKQKNWQNQTQTELLIQQLRNISQDEKRKILETDLAGKRLKTEDIKQEEMRARIWAAKNANELKAAGLESSDPYLVRLLYRAMNNIINNGGVSATMPNPIKK